MKPIERIWRGAAAAVMLAALAVPAAAQQQFQGICATAKIEILQELTIERMGFEATLEITNNESEDPITDFYASLVFYDPDDEEGTDVSDMFFVRQLGLRDINRIDGDGVIGPTKTAQIRWFIIPKIGAGGTDPRGKEYLVGVNMSGKVAGVEIPEDNMFAIPETISVYPEPELEITYFMPRDVQADDPFTPEVESPIPFTLGVLVKNTGYGIARSLKIDSQQPRIVENNQGLLLVARLLGARVMDSPLDRASLLVDLGDIYPGETKKGAWDMITSLSGEFIDFKASYTHSSELGGMETSVIRSIDAHFIVREVINDQPGRDGILDFLAVTDRNEALIPDAMYESEGNVTPVNHLTQVTVTSGIGPDRKFTMDVTADFEGWGFVRIDDPGQARFAIERVVRSDGKVINGRNVWTNIRYEPGSNRKLTYLNLFDLVDLGATYEYTVEYKESGLDNEPPVTEIHFAGEVFEADGKYYVNRETEIFFIAEDESPVSMYYKIGDEAFRPALPFTIREPGEHQITYYAEDIAGNREAEKTAIVVLPGEAGLIADFDSEEVSLLHSGETLSVRPDGAEISVTAAPGAVAVDAQIDIFAGVIAWPTIAGVPPSPAPSGSASLTVSGSHVDFYRYRLNGGTWSEERPVAEKLVLDGLSGDVTVAVLGRSIHGGYLPESEALEVTWKVDASAPAFSVAGVPPSPTAARSVTLTVESAGADLYRWTINGGYFRAEAPLTEPILLSALTPGTQTVSLIGKTGDEWQETENATTVTWVVDPEYGSDFSRLTLVRSATFPGVQGQTVRFLWDGRDDAGNLAPAGWYVVRVRLVDSLGNVAHASKLVQVQNLAAGEATVADASRGAAGPHARGDWVVWQDRAEGSWNIVGRRLTAPSAPVQPITTGSAAQENPYTDGRYVVWQGRRENGAWDIWIRDLNTFAPASRVTSSPERNDIKPVIDWPWIAFQSRPVNDSQAPWQIRAINILTGENFLVNPSTENQQDLDIHAGRIVWQDHRDVGPGEIYFADLETGETRRITDNTDGQYHPKIFGNWIVWQDNRHTQLELYGMDLLRGTETRLTNSPENETRPFLLGHWVVMEEDSVGANLSNIRLLSLDNLRVAPLTNTISAKTRPVLAAGQLVWQETTDGGEEIRTAGIPALQQVFDNNNAVVVTAALADRYGDAFNLLEAWQDRAGVVAIERVSNLLPAVEIERASWEGGAASGENFTLQEGGFLWVSFDEGRILDLGTVSGEIDLSDGVTSLGYAGFPAGYTAHRMARQLGAENVRALRMLDAASGFWKTIEVRNGLLTGPDFPIPEVAVIFVDMVEPVTGWRPEL